MVFLFQILVKASPFFPFDNGQHCVERIEVRDLDIGGVFIVVVIRFVLWVAELAVAVGVGAREDEGKDAEEAVVEDLGAADQGEAHAEAKETARVGNVLEKNIFMVIKCFHNF